MVCIEPAATLPGGPVSWWPVCLTTRASSVNCPRMNERRQTDMAKLQELVQSPQPLEEKQQVVLQVRSR